MDTNNHFYSEQNFEVFKCLTIVTRSERVIQSIDNSKIFYSAFNPLPDVKLLKVILRLSPFVLGVLYDGGTWSHLNSFSGQFQVEAPIHTHWPLGMSLQNEWEIK